MNASILNALQKKYESFMVLTIFIDVSKNNNNDNNNNDNLLVTQYQNAINVHNNKILDLRNHFIDSGFDLFVPEQQVCKPGQINKVNTQVKCSAQFYKSQYQNQYQDQEQNKRIFTKTNTGYYMYPRSSISKTPLRLANSVGIIDSGYRGHLMGMFDCLPLVQAGESYTIQPFDRLLQICSPDLGPIYVILVDFENELGGNTERGTGGFGSTGR
jgi:dUTP pyrophosphatase